MKDKEKQRAYQQLWYIINRKKCSTEEKKKAKKELRKRHRRLEDIKLTKEEKKKYRRKMERKYRRYRQRLYKRICTRDYGGPCEICGGKKSLRFHKKDGHPHPPIHTSIKNIKILKNNKNEWALLCQDCHNGVHWLMRARNMKWDKIESILHR